MQLPLTIRRKAGVKRLTLRLSRNGDEIVVTAPRRAPVGEIQRFVDRHQDWVAKRVQALPGRTEFTLGETIPYRGIPHRLEISGKLRGQIEVHEGELCFPCLPEHLPRRVRTWLAAQAKAALTAAVAEKAALLGRPMPPLTIRDTKSRWGSCSHQGALSFSWRLILAPPAVLTYVAAHEVAHLAQMNHSPAYWEVCRRLDPNTDAARKWLKQHGAGLHCYG
jgi:predicted metal-dependent hydrolase